MKIQVMSVEQDGDGFMVVVAGDGFKEKKIFASSKDSLIAQLKRIREMESDFQALNALVGTTVEV